MADLWVVISGTWIDEETPVYTTEADAIAAAKERGRLRAVPLLVAIRAAEDEAASQATEGW